MNQLKIYLPPPSNWQDLQSLAAEIARTRYDPQSVQEYGRQGQGQQGVDVYAMDKFGKSIGIQCKETKKALTENVVLKEADEAKKFSPALDYFIIATTARRDAVLQAAVFRINKSDQFPFRIRIDSWDEMMDDINRFGAVLNNCYGSYSKAFQRSDEANHLACLRVAFDRPAFTDDFLYERNYDNFESALVSLKRLFRTGFVEDRLLKIPVVQTVPVDFLPEGHYRKFVDSLERKLEQIYRRYISNKSKILQFSQHATECAGQFNIQRRALLVSLNDHLEEAGLMRIQYQYE